jgi:adenylylsulfate kinase-like enzyme
MGRWRSTNARISAASDDQTNNSGSSMLSEGERIMEAIPVLVLTGPICVGKTTVAAEVSEGLDAAGIAHAIVDIDSLRWCYPRPSNDPFRVALAMRNLAAVWANFRGAGATRLIVADVVEARDHLDRYRVAVPGAEIVVVRLTASLSTLTLRVQRREQGLGLARHLQRVSELANLMERTAVEDILVPVDGKTVGEIAREVLMRTRWLDVPDVE